MKETYYFVSHKSAYFIAYVTTNVPNKYVIF